MEDCKATKPASSDKKTDQLHKKNGPNEMILQNDTTTTAIAEKSSTQERDMKVNMLRANTNALDSIYATIDGYTLARDYRTALRAEGKFSETENLQYGEVDNYAFASLLEQAVASHVKVQSESTDKTLRLKFLDIGAGTGKPLLCAAATGIFNHCIGFEIVPSLCQAAAQAVKEASESKHTNGTEFIKTYYQNCLPGKQSLLKTNSIHISSGLQELCTDEEIQHQWQVADVFFAPVTCFAEESLHEVVREINSQLKPGCLVISTSTLQRLDVLANRIDVATADKKRTGKGVKSLIFLEEKRLRYGKGTMPFYLFRKCNTNN